MHRTAVLVLLGALAAACSKSPETQPEPETVGARINTNLEAPIARGDCKEAVRRAMANPNIDVEKVATPLAMTPPPVDGRKMPKGVADRNGWFNVKFHVMVDTAGKADMKTFAIDTASHAWLATSVKTAVAKWSFAPAEVAGCRIPRNYSLGISPRGKSPYVAPKPAARAPAKPAAKKPPVG
jgi:hypothetical protein